MSDFDPDEPIDVDGRLYSIREITIDETAQLAAIIQATPTDPASSMRNALAFVLVGADGEPADPADLGAIPMRAAYKILEWAEGIG